MVKCVQCFRNSEILQQDFFFNQMYPQLENELSALEHFYVTIILKTVTRFKSFDIVEDA